MEENKQAAETTTALIHAELEKEEGVLNREQIYEIMDRIDDLAVMNKVGQEVLADMVYRFSDESGKTVLGLSKIGVDSAAAQLAGQGIIIREVSVDFKETPDVYYFTAKAARFARDNYGNETELESAFGFKRQQKRQFQNVPVRDEHGKKIYNTDGNVKREYKEVENKFAFEQGGIKAVRNAKRRLIGESLIKRLIEAKLNQGKVQDIKVKQIADEADYYNKDGKKIDPAEAKKAADAKAAADLKEYEEIYKKFSSDFVASVINVKYNVKRLRDIPLDKLKADLPALLKAYEDHKTGTGAAVKKGITPSNDPQTPAAAPASAQIPPPAPAVSATATDGKAEYKYTPNKDSAEGLPLLVEKIQGGRIASRYEIARSADGKLMCSCPARKECKHIKEAGNVLELYREFKKAEGTPPPVAKPSAAPAKTFPSFDRKKYEAIKDAEGIPAALCKYLQEVHAFRGAALFNLITKLAGKKSFNDITEKDYKQVWEYQIFGKSTEELTAVLNAK
jgi:hypothetical protein